MGGTENQFLPYPREQCRYNTRPSNVLYITLLFSKTDSVDTKILLSDFV